jgi:hypothetical protein
MLPVMFAVPWPPRLIVGTTRPRFGESQHMMVASGLAARTCATCATRVVDSLRIT